MIQLTQTLISGDCLAQLKTLPDHSIDSLVTDPPAGISFMGKDWDHHKGGRDEWIAWMESVMRECLRVMKPGAHGLVWAIPRTSHWTGMACERAGFEIRDVVSHLFGSGFPKSLDVSKAIDKAAGAEREVIGPNPSAVGRMTNKTGGKLIGGIGGDRAFVDVLTIPATDDAKKWQGWGTALKPACEMWWLIRKPCSEKTVTANVLKWGTGALNIDASRVSVSESDPNHRKPSVCYADGSMFGMGGRIGENLSAQGRFPANLVLSCSPHCTEESHDIECAIAALDAQSGITKATKTNRDDGRVENDNLVYGKGLGRHGPLNSRADSGGASRFFYCAKASKSDKGAANTHPTVKSTRLMEHLIRMVTPPGGTVLDPFAGSGSTGVAAKRLGFEFIGIEREQEYAEIALKRMEAVESVEHP